MSDFEKLARGEQQSGIFSEFMHFVSNSKKYWLLPILAVVLIFGLLVLFSGTAAAPFIYTLF